MPPFVSRQDQRLQKVDVLREVEARRFLCSRSRRGVSTRAADIDSIY